MPYIPRAEQERANWRTLPEAVAHVMRIDRCSGEDARRQINDALGDGALTLRWEDAPPPPSGDGRIFLPLDRPPKGLPHWRKKPASRDGARRLKRGWFGGDRHRVLLITD